MCKVALVFPESFARFVENLKNELEKEGCGVEVVLSEGPIPQERKRTLLANSHVYVTGA